MGEILANIRQFHSPVVFLVDVKIQRKNIISALYFKIPQNQKEIKIYANTKHNFCSLPYLLLCNHYYSLVFVKFINDSFHFTLVFWWFKISLDKSKCWQLDSEIFGHTCQIDLNAGNSSYIMIIRLVDCFANQRVIIIQSRLKYMYSLD